VAVWLDDLSRELLASGELQSVITGRHVVGVTANPTIFASAPEKGDRYSGRLRVLAELGASTETAIFTVTTDDARDAAATPDMARALRSAVDRDNMFVKIPATPEGSQRYHAGHQRGIRVNLTLIFAVARYHAVMDAYLGGLEQAAAAGWDLAAIRSVASFFISRVDSEVDARLDRMATSQPRSSGEGLPSPTPAWPTRPMRKSSLASDGKKLAGLGA
jgi:transaldolase